jgi:hypothetical protein
MTRTRTEPDTWIPPLAGGLQTGQPGGEDEIDQAIDAWIWGDWGGAPTAQKVIPTNVREIKRNKRSIFRQGMEKIWSVGVAVMAKLRPDFKPAPVVEEDDDGWFR